MFREVRMESGFNWEMLGDIKIGRPNLGFLTSVMAYRLMQFTIRDALICEYGPEAADKIFYQAGLIAGSEFYKNAIEKKDTFDSFISDLQEKLVKERLGILRIESADLESGNLILTIAEDLDCSGIPICSEQICTWDEGFISGLLKAHTGKEFLVKEIDCWCSGDRVCRFEAKNAIHE